MDFNQSLSEWVKDKPLSILQLDPADRAVLKIADERDAIQKKTFTKWVNKHLKKHWRYVENNRHVDDLFEDLRDGNNLISLLEVLSGELLPREKGRLRFHMLQNIQIALDFLKFKKIRLVNIRPEDIVDGNPKLTLGLIWTIILHFQISDIITGLTDECVTAREALLSWAQRSTERYPGVKVTNFTSSWRNGLAFLAIIHRNRPDLLDFHSLNANSARENLEKAFSIAEKEFGATRLLDPEDVDTPEPDEKSIITYISSIYDVFPEPPSRHPLADEERHSKVEEYKEQCIRLQMWLLESVHILQNRAFFNTVVEMKNLLTECSRFRADDITKHMKEKQKLVQLSKDIQKMSQDLGEITFEGDLKLESVEKNWELMFAAYHERDQAIRGEIARLEKLQKIADKLSRDLKQCDSKVNDADKKIKEELKRVQRLQTPDAKHNCEQIASTLKDIDDHINTMKKDARYLFQNNFYQAADLEKRITRLHDRFSTIRIIFESELLVALTQKVDVSEKIVTKQKAFLSDQRETEITKALQTIKEHTEYLEKKMIIMEKLKDSEWGTDGSTVKINLDQHRSEHKLIHSYRRKIDQLQKNALGNDNKTFCEAMNVLEESYKELLGSSSERLKDLEILSEFFNSATKELKWISEKVDIEVSRDWSSKNLNIADIHHYQECLTKDLEKRERHLTDIQKKGEKLLQKHPSLKNIEGLLCQLQELWSFLLQLACCLETHLKHAQLCQQYFKDGKDCEQHLKSIEEKLNTSFSRTITSVDEGEKILKQVHKIRDDLSSYNKALLSLSQRSSQVTSLKQRRHPISKSLKVMAICNYNKNNVSILKNDNYILRDNSQEWKIVGDDGVEVRVPGVCFIIPPPSLEVIELYEHLKKRHDAIMHLWTVKEKALRQSLIVATIKVVKSWDVSQFRSMGATQRDSIIKALNEDAEKLLAEGSGEEPMLVQLKSEMENCNKMFQNLQEKAHVDETKKTTKASGKREKFEEENESLQNDLNEKMACLKSKLNEQIELNLDALENLVLEHKDFELCIRTVEEKIKEVKHLRRSSTKRSPNQLRQYDSIISTWDKIWELSNLYVERLKALEVTIHDYQDAFRTISSTEVKLASFDKMSSDMESLENTHEELMQLQTQMLQQQSVIDSVSESFKNVRTLVRLSRPNQSVHCDLNKFENDIRKLIARWDNIFEQLVARLRSCGASSELLRTYQNKSKHDKLWMSETAVKVHTLKSVKTLTTKEVEMEVEPVMNLYSSIADQSSSIEHTNLLGARYIREAKIYDLRLKHYKENLEEEHPSLDASLHKKTQFISGAEIVERDLDDLNQQYGKQVQLVLNYLGELKSSFSQNSEFKLSKVISKATPISLKTFRTAIDQAPALTSLTIESYSSLPAQSSSPSTFNTEIQAARNENDLAINTSDFVTFTKKGVPFNSEMVGLHKTEQEQGKMFLWDIPGIFDGKSEEKISLNNAIRCGILDLKTVVYNDLITNHTFPLYDAMKAGYVDSDLYERVTKKCGIFYPDEKEELSLIEAINKNLYDINSGALLNPQNTQPITLTDAFHIGILKRNRPNKMIEMGFIKTSNFTISEAVQQEYLNPNTGFFKNPYTGLEISFSEAIDQNFLLISLGDVAPTKLTLAKAIDMNIIENVTGIITDKEERNTFSIPEAIASGVLDPNVPEIVDTESLELIRIDDAIERGILDVVKGKYINKRDHSVLSLKEARDNCLIFHPLSIKEALQKNLIDDDGLVLNPLNVDEKLSLINALAKGVLDADSKCIIHPNNHNILSLPLALKENILTPSGKLIRNENEILALNELKAAEFVVDTSCITVFERKCIKDFSAGKMICFNDAISRNIIDLKSSCFINSLSQERISFQEAAAQNIIDRELFNVLSWQIGFKDENNVPLTILECFNNGIIDSKTGYLYDPKSNKRLFIREAIERNVITPHGAAILKGLLNIALTTDAIGIADSESDLTEKVIDTVSNKSYSKSSTFQDLLDNIGAENYYGCSNAYAGSHNQKRSSQIPVLSPSLKATDMQQDMGILSLNSFTTSTDNLYPTRSVTSMFVEEDNTNIQKEGIIASNTNSSDCQEIPKPDSLCSVECISSENVEYNLIPEKNETDIYSMSKVSPKDFSFPSTINSIPSLECKEPPAYIQVLNIPPAGWPLNEAISNKILNANSGIFTVPGTCRLLSFEETVRMEIINPNSAFVKCPETMHLLSLQEAFTNKILDSYGHYYCKKSNMKLSLAEAISQKEIVFSYSNSLQNYSSKSTDNNDQQIESSSLPSVKKNILGRSQAPLKPDFVQIQPGIYFNRQCLLIHNTVTGEESSLQAAVFSGMVDTSLFVVKDPKKENFIALDKALTENIIHHSDGGYYIDTEKKISFLEAFEKGYISLIPDIADEKTTKFMYSHKDDENSSQNKTFIHSKLKNSDMEIKISPNRCETIWHEACLSDATKITSELYNKFSMPRIKQNVLPPHDALKFGFIDSEAFDLIKSHFSDSKNSSITLKDAINQLLIDGNKGKITNIKTLQEVCMKDGIEMSILDSNSGNLRIPIARSLNIPEAYEHGLIDPQSKGIIHPETGCLMSIHNAILCDVINPYSLVVNQRTNTVVTLESMIKEGFIDSENNVKLPNGNIDLIQACGIDNLFLSSKPEKELIASLAPTLAVAVQYNIVNLSDATYIHPITKVASSLNAAIENNAIMCFPVNKTSKSVTLWDALKQNLINFQDNTFQHPENVVPLPLGQAIEKGLLVIEPIEDELLSHKSNITNSTPCMSRTSSYSTGHLLEHSGEETFLNAYEKYLEPETGLFVDPYTSELKPFEALAQKGIFPGNAKISNMKDGSSVSLNEALESKVIDPVSGKYFDSKSGKKMYITDAVKLGLIALVGVPIATVAITSSAIKSLAVKLSDGTTFKSREKPSEIIHESGEKHNNKEFMHIASSEVLQCSELHGISLQSLDSSVNKSEIAVNETLQIKSASIQLKNKHGLSLTKTHEQPDNKQSTNILSTVYQKEFRDLPQCEMNDIQPSILEMGTSNYIFDMLDNPSPLEKQDISHSVEEHVVTVRKDATESEVITILKSEENQSEQHTGKYKKPFEDFDQIVLQTTSEKNDKKPSQIITKGFEVPFPGKPIVTISELENLTASQEYNEVIAFDPTFSIKSNALIEDSSKPDIAMERNEAPSSLNTDVLLEINSYFHSRSGNHDHEIVSNPSLVHLQSASGKANDYSFSRSSNDLLNDEKLLSPSISKHTTTLEKNNKCVSSCALDPVCQEFDPKNVTTTTLTSTLHNQHTQHFITEVVGSTESSELLSQSLYVKQPNIFPVNHSPEFPTNQFSETLPTDIKSEISFKLPELNSPEMNQSSQNELLTGSHVLTTGRNFSDPLHKNNEHQNLIYASQPISTEGTGSSIQSTCIFLSSKTFERKRTSSSESLKEKKSESQLEHDANEKVFAKISLPSPTGFVSISGPEQELESIEETIASFPPKILKSETVLAHSSSIDLAMPMNTADTFTELNTGMLTVNASKSPVSSNDYDMISSESFFSSPESHSLPLLVKDSESLNAITGKSSSKCLPYQNFSITTQTATTHHNLKSQSKKLPSPEFSNVILSKGSKSDPENSIHNTSGIFAQKSDFVTFNQLIKGSETADMSPETENLDTLLTPDSVLRKSTLKSDRSTKLSDNESYFRSNIHQSIWHHPPLDCASTEKHGIKEENELNADNRGLSVEKVFKQLTTGEAIQSNLINVENDSVINNSEKVFVNDVPVLMLIYDQNDIDIETMKESETILSQDSSETAKNLMQGKSDNSIEENYKICKENTGKLLAWIKKTELQLAGLGLVKEDFSTLELQINTTKALKDELMSQQHLVNTCIDQVRQLVQEGFEILSKDEVHGLQKDLQTVKKRYDLLISDCDKLLHRLTAAIEELQKFKTEIRIFKEWLIHMQKTYNENQANLGYLRALVDNSEKFRNFSSDVIAHQADIRFITMSAQKFVDESKEYLKILNILRVNLPERLPHMEPVESQVKAEVKEITASFMTLLNNVNRLGDNFMILCDKHRYFIDTYNKAIGWLNDIQMKVKDALKETISAEPNVIQEQLDHIKTLNTEIVGQGRLIENIEEAVRSLENSVEKFHVESSEVKDIELSFRNLKKDYDCMVESVSAKIKEIQVALIQSHDISDGLDRLLKWLDETDSSFLNHCKSISLNFTKLDEQVQEFKILQSDINSQKQSVEAVDSAVKKLLDCNPKSAKKIESKLKDIVNRFQKLCDNVEKREELLKEISTSARTVNALSLQFEDWITSMLERTEEHNVNAEFDVDGFTSVVEHLINQRITKVDEYEHLMKISNDLALKPGVTDSSSLKEKIKSIEHLWKVLGNILEEKKILSKTRTEQLAACEMLRQTVAEWLLKMETFVDGLEPASLVDADLKKQIDEMKPVTKDYNNYSTVVDKLNNLGSTCDVAIKEDQLKHKTFFATKPTSPIKNVTSAIRKSQSSTKLPDSLPTSPSKGQLSSQSPLSTASSGFGSRKNSSDNFTVIDDLNPIQQQLSVINHRYSLLGVKLNDRSQELNQLIGDLKNASVNRKMLEKFLETKKKQLPEDSLPASKQQAESYSTILKAIQDEIIEKQSDLDNFKSQASQILQRKSNVKGTSEFQQKCNEIDTKWEELRSSIKKNLVFLQDFKNFQDTFSILQCWLLQRQKMFQVLGPIASDPRMVSSQVQQVSVMKDEFSSETSLLDNFNKCGNAIKQYLDVTGCQTTKITEQMTVIRTLWDDLIAHLEERNRNLENAGSVAKNFYMNQSKIQETLQKISDNFEQCLCASNTSIQQQLKKVIELEDELEKQRPLLIEADSICEELCEILSDSLTKNDVREKINSLEKLYSALNKKINNRKTELESCLKEYAEFHETCETFQAWLEKNSNNFLPEMLFSADVKALTIQVQDYEPKYKSFIDKEHELHLLVNKGSEILGKVIGKPTRSDQLKARLENIQSQYEKVKAIAINRHTSLQCCLENCNKFETVVNQFLPWLEKSEEKFASIKISGLERSTIIKHIKEMQVMKTDVTKHIQEFETIRQLGNTLIECCHGDRDRLKKQIAGWQKKWENLNQDMTKKMLSFEDLSLKLAEYREKLRDLQHSIQRLEDKIASHDAIGNVSQDPTLLGRIKTLQQETAENTMHFENIKEYVKKVLLIGAGSSADTSEINKELEDLAEKLHCLVDGLNARSSNLSMATKLLSVFNTQIKSIHTEIESLDSILNKMNLVAQDKKMILQQITEVKEFKTIISKVRISYENAEKQCIDITSKGYLQDTRACKEQLSSLKKEITRLEELIKIKESSLETLLTRINCFSEHCHKTRKELDNVVKEEASLKCITGDVESIRLQQKAFKKFRNEKIQPLNKMIEVCYKMGQGVIESSSTDASINELELDSLNELCNKLQERITEREKKLDVALLQSGKFEEAIDGVQKWLLDTEEMIINQKAPSSDFKVVKAQVQEQKFLKKMLLDRQNSVMSLKVTGTELMQNTATKKEQEQVNRQMVTIIERFEELNVGANERMKTLEKTSIVAQEFQNSFSPLSEWIEKSEKKLSTMDIIPVENTRIKKMIMEHKVLQEDIISRKKELDKLKSLSEKLKQSVGKDDLETLDTKMQLLLHKYSEMTETCSIIRRELVAAEKGLVVFSEKYEKSISGIEKSLAQLSRFHMFSVYADKLQAQMKDLNKLKDNISREKSDVELVLSTGQEIMKHASGQDTIQVKQKLDTLNIKFAEAINRTEERQKVSEEMLPLVKSFYEAITRLSKWLESTERSIKTLESTCLTTQQTSIKKLQTEIHEYRCVLEIVNHNGPKICQLSQGNETSLVESMMSKSNHRFDVLTESVQRKAERIELAVQRKFDVVGDIDEILDWFKEIEKQIGAIEGLSPEPDSLLSLLNEQKAMNNDICSQKTRVRDILAAAKKLMRESSTEDLSHIHERAETLKSLSNNMSMLSQDRLSLIEQALPLAEHFFETHTDLTQWLDVAEGEAEALEAPALNAVQIKKQQERNKGLVQSVNEHKPLVEKLNKTGSALSKLCKEDETDKVDVILESDNSRYNALRQVLREHQNALEEALQATSQFSDKLEGMLSALTSTADQIQNAEPISAHPERIQEQIHDNKAVVQDLEKRITALEAVKKAADDVIVKAGSIDEPAVKDITKKLDHLNFLWNTIQTAARNRGKSLEDALIAAERFWDELTAVMKALKELKDNLNCQEVPAVEPSAVQQQQDALLEIKQEISQTKPEVDHCRQAGQDLMQLCGEPDKPEVKKHIEDLDSAWENVTTLYAKREQNLIDAMEKAMSFHETLQNLFEFLDTAEENFSTLGAVSSDIESVKRQVKQLKAFKAEVDPHMIEVEALNRQAQELVERTLPDKALAIREPLDDMNKRWNDLLKGIVDRQREMENVLLKLGQFQHTLEELVTWMTKTEIALDELKPVVFGDPQVIEVVLAKHKVLVNDIQAHETSIEAINSAGHQLGEAGENSKTQDVKSTRNKLNNLNLRWQQLQGKSFDRQRELEDALKEALQFYQEIQDLLMWISDLDGQLVTSKPVGGLPETAKEQLARFMDMYNELDSNRHKIESVLQQGQNYSKRSAEGSAKKLLHNLNTLRQRWENVLNKANDRKIKLEIALREATEFHEALQNFVEWLTNSEKYLTSLKPVSRSMSIVMEQIEDHKNFQKDVGLQREVMMNLDKKGTHLKYFSQKQDVILIKNLLISVQHRWERVVSKAAERTRLLDHGYKEAKEFHESWTSLSNWLEEAEKTLDSITHISNEPTKIKQLLVRHKEFQRVLGSKQTSLDTTMRIGRTLKDKSPKPDVQSIQNMMDELKSRWNRVCTKSVDRQRKLEEALLYSGQFKEAVQVLLDWLEKSIAKLSESKSYHGDLDTVTAIIEKHKVFEEEMKSRNTSLETLRKTSEELKIHASAEDSLKISTDMGKLESNWLKMKEMDENYRNRLEDALKLAERLHKEVHMLLEWLSDAEMKLRFIGPLLEDEESTKGQILLHQEFLKELDSQRINKDSILNLAQSILKKCHPDGVSVVRHYITIIQSRWEEISSWAKQRDQRLHDHLQSIKDIVKLLEELLAWLIKAETNLTALEAEPLPDDVDILQELIKEHQSFMDNMTKKQPDIEKISKTFSLKNESNRNLVPFVSRDKVPKDRSTRLGVLPAPAKTSTPLQKQPVETDIKHPKAHLLLEKWRQVWLLAMERQRRLQEKFKYLKELERIRNFDFDEWRKRYLGWMNNKKSRIMDQFRKIDKNSDGKVTKEEFIDGILQSKFATSHLEMEKVSDIFDINGDGFIDTKEYIDTLRPDREAEPQTEAEKIQDEVHRQVAKCTCVHRFKVYQVGEGKYRFGDSQKLRLVRILRSTVMVRVGGGWLALDEFLVKNDPCRAKGRTNLELREQFILAEGVSQSMTPFKPKASPNSSVSSQSGVTSRALSIQSAGPITKIREKSERSAPMHKGRSADTSSDTSGPSFSETKSYSNQSGALRQSPANNRHPETRVKGLSSKTNSHPSSRQGSRPSSRTASDLSQDGIESYKKGKKGLTDDSTSLTKTSGTSSLGSKIPFVKRSTAKSPGIEENQKDIKSK